MASPAGSKWSLAPGLALTVVLAILARKLEALPFPPFTLKGSPRLSTADLKDPGPLAAGLRDAKDPRSRYIKDRCSPETRKALDGLKDGAAPPKDLVGALAKELNRVVEDAGFYEAGRFKGVDLLRDETRALAAKSGPSGGDPQARLRFNRLLLEAAFPKRIKPLSNSHPIDALLFAIILGMILRNFVKLPTWLGPGIRYSVHSLLSIAIVFMGARLDFFDVGKIAGGASLIIVACVTAAFVMTVWLCRRMNVGEKLGLLIGSGTAICGGTAIAVTAPVIEAEDNDTAFAITTITIFGVISIFLFPFLGKNVFPLTDEQFGTWAGTAVHATPQVIAAGFAFSPEAGARATVVKLVRVLLLAPLVILIRIWYARRKHRLQQAYVAQRLNLATLFPLFILGFVLVALANTFKLLPDFTMKLKENFLWAEGPAEFKTTGGDGILVKWSNFLIAMSMAGVGLGVHFQSFKKTGLTPLLVGLFSATILAGLSLALIKLLV